MILNNLKQATTRHRPHLGRMLQGPLWHGSSACSFSTPASGDPPLTTFGLGGHKWTRVSQTPQSYELYIRTALEQGVTLLEAGQEGGEQALVNALQECLNSRADLFQRHPIIVTSRLGYRSWTMTTPSSGAGESVADLANEENLMKADVVVEETSQPATEDVAGTMKTTVVHNMSPEYIEHYLNTSPLASFCDTAGAPQITWMPLLHNPEAQLMPLIQGGELPSVEDRMEHMRPILHSAMEALESANAINQFGVVSNGLGLPQSHPMHLSHELLVPEDKKKQFSKFTAVQLPANMLEPNGLMVARKIKSRIEETKSKDLDIWAMRPLTAYPVHLGTGLEKPYKLFDYPVTSIDMSKSAEEASKPPPKSIDVNGNEKHWTHQWDGPPPIYQVALQTCMSHFDAELILEAQLERELTTEERETIDGCKLIQSMLHDLDVAMNNYNSLDVFEEDLYQRIIPLLADTFESLDETSSDVLQAFFSAYALAVRYTIAQKTRRILREGLTKKDLVIGGRPSQAGADGDGEGSAPAPSQPLQPTPTYPSLDAERSLQELALRHVLGEEAISRIVVGTTSSEELRDTLSLVRHVTDHK